MACSDASTVFLKLKESFWEWLHFGYKFQVALFYFELCDFGNIDEYSDIEEVPTAENSFNRKKVKNKDVSPWTAGPSASMSDDRGPSVSISVVKNSKPLPLPPGIHGGGKGLYKCNMCDSRFFSDGELKTHIITVHEAEKKYYACSVCEARFVI